MRDEPNDAPLRDLVREINERDAGRIAVVMSRLSTREGVSLLHAIGEYLARLGFGNEESATEEDFPSDRVDFYEQGAEAFVQVLLEHPLFYEDRQLEAGIPVIGEVESGLPFAEGRRDAARLLAAGALAVGYRRVPDERYGDALRPLEKIT
jgi:hypothetical protein